MKVTIGIATWNRARWLDLALAAVRKLQVPSGAEHTVLVVKNNCTDGTDAVLERHAPALPLRVLEESGQGVSAARNRILDAAEGDLVLFVDDDAMVTPGWLAGYVAAAREHPDVTVFGGPIEPIFEVPPPAWFESIWPEVRSLYGDLRLSDEPFLFDPARPNRLPYGSNFGGRAEVLQAYRFDTTLGHSAKERIAGEDTAYVMRVLADGHRGMWLPDTTIQHWVRREGLTLRHVRGSMFMCGRTDRVMARSAPRGTRFQAWRRCLRQESKVHLYGVLGRTDKQLKYALRASYNWGLLLGKPRVGPPTER